MCLAAIKGQSTSLLPPILFLPASTSSYSLLLLFIFFLLHIFFLLLSSHISFPPLLILLLCTQSVTGVINTLFLSRLQKNSAEREDEGEKEEEGRGLIKEEGNNVLNLSQAQSDVPDDSLRWEHSLWKEQNRT